MAEQPALGFAGLLRLLRAEARLTQEELAKAAGISPRSVSDLERGINRTARKDTAELLAGALGLAGPVRAYSWRRPAAALQPRRCWRPCASRPRPARPGVGGVPVSGAGAIREDGTRGSFTGASSWSAQLVQRLMERLDGPGILLVAGESGTGKSSLLKRGVMPRLAAGALGPGSERWPRRVIRPTDSPLGELAMQLADVAGQVRFRCIGRCRAAPGEAPMLVELAVRTAIGHGVNTRSGALADAAAAEPPRLVLVVDQFEELFTAGVDTDVSRVEREAFIAALHAAATVPGGPAENAAGAGGRGGARGFPRPPHHVSADEGRAGRRALHGRADE